MADWVDIAGVAGFVLSLSIAISQALSNRLRIKAGPFTLIEAYNKAPDSIFLFVCLSNRTKIPFSLTDVYISLGKNGGKVKIERTVRTYRRNETANKLAVKPVVLSQTFPVRFESYASQVFLLEVLRQNIDMKSLRPDAPAHSPKEPIHRPLCRMRNPYTRSLRPRLVLSTSRGRRAIPIYVEEVQNWDWLEAYAVRKAALEEKIVFP